MKAVLRQKAVELRLKQNLSYQGIMKIIPVSKSTLSYWLRDLPLSKERILKLRRAGWEKGEASRELFRETMRSKRAAAEKLREEEYAKKFRTVSREAYFIAGLMLYLGEGDKRNRNRVGLVNTDPQIILFFLRWLESFFLVKRLDIRSELHLYDSMNIPSVESFWTRTLGISRKQLYKTQVKKVSISGHPYEGPHRFGTCSVFLGNTQIKAEIMAAIGAFMKKYANIGQSKRV